MEDCESSNYLFHVYISLLIVRHSKKYIKKPELWPFLWVQELKKNELTSRETA